MLGIRPADFRPPPSITGVAGLSPTRVGFDSFFNELAPGAVFYLHAFADALRTPPLELGVPNAPVRLDTRMHRVLFVLAAMLAWVVLPIGGRFVALAAARLGASPTFLLQLLLFLLLRLLLWFARRAFRGGVGLVRR